MARDYTGRLVKDKVEMSLATKVTLLVIGIIFMLAAITAPLVVLITKENTGSVAYGDFLYQYNIENGNVYYDIKKYIGSNTENVIIPSEYDGAPVVGIMKNAFNGTKSNVVKNIKKITFDNTSYSGIRRIDSEAFVGLENLQGLTLPTHVTTIAQNAFVNCTIKGDVEVSELGSYYESSAGIVSKVTLSNAAFKNCQMAEGATLVIKKSSKEIVPSEILSTFGKLGATKVTLGQDVNLYNLGQSSFATFAKMEELTLYNAQTPSWASNATQSNITGKNLTLDECSNLKKINVLYAENQPTIVSSFMQKFLYAPALETVTFGQGIDKLGAGIFSCDGNSKGFEALKNIVVSGNLTFDADGNITNFEASPTARRGTTVDANIMKTKQFNDVKIYFDNAYGENEGRTYKLNGHETSIVNILRISNDRGHLASGDSYNGPAITASFSKMFAEDGLKASTVRELIIDCNSQSGIQNITDNGLDVFFNKALDISGNYTAGEGFTLVFDGNGIGSLGAGIISTANVQKVDVFGPTVELSTVFVKFNTTGGADASPYRDRRTYNTSVDLSDIEYILVFNVNKGGETANIATLTVSASEIESATSTIIESVSIPNIKNGDTIAIAHDQNKNFNEYELVGWANYKNNNFESTNPDDKLSLTINPDGTVDFQYNEDENSPLHWYYSNESLNKIAVRTVNFYAEWDRKN